MYYCISLWNVIDILYLNFRQYSLEKGLDDGISSSHINNTASNTPNTKKVMLVYMIGGLTYLEIAAIRALSKHPSFPYTIIMATTKIINANSLLTSLITSNEANIMK